MKKKRTFWYLMIVSVLFLYSFPGCVNRTDTKDDRLKVIVSILPQKAFVQAVGGNLLDVQELIPPGGSPATYEPKPSDLIKVEEADLYFRIGYIPFELAHMKRFSQLNSEMKIIDTSANMLLRYFDSSEEHSHHHEHEEDDEHLKAVDPHIWLSPLLVKQQIQTITGALVEIDPGNAKIYQKNAKAYQQKLDALDQELQQVLSGLSPKKLLVFHPSWGYFTDRYSLQQIAIEQNGKEPTIDQMQHLIHTTKLEDIKVIFVQAQFNKQIAQSVAEEIGGVVVTIDPLAENYLDNLKKVGQIIREHLGKKE